MLPHLRSDSETGSPRTSSALHGAGMTNNKSPKGAKPAADQFPRAPSPGADAEPAPSPQVPIITKYTLKGSRARIVLRALMGNVEAALEILEWAEEDLNVLSPSLLLPIRFIACELNPFSCTRDRVLQSVATLKKGDCGPRGEAIHPGGQPGPSL